MRGCRADTGLGRLRVILTRPGASLLPPPRQTCLSRGALSWRCIARVWHAHTSISTVATPASTLALRSAARAAPRALLTSRSSPSARRPLARAAPMASASICSVAALETPHVAAAAATLAEAFSYDSQYSWSRPLGLPQDRFVAWLEHIYLPERAAGAHEAAQTQPRKLLTPLQASPRRLWRMAAWLASLPWRT